jgi:hypothetical protein
VIIEPLSTRGHTRALGTTLYVETHPPLTLEDSSPSRKGDLI